MIRRPPRSTLFPTRRSSDLASSSSCRGARRSARARRRRSTTSRSSAAVPAWTAAEDLDRSEEHTSELQSQSNLVCRLLLEKKKKNKKYLRDKITLTIIL